MRRGGLMCARSSVKRMRPLLVDKSGGVTVVDVEQYAEKSVLFRRYAVAVMNSINGILSPIHSLFA